MRTIKHICKVGDSFGVVIPLKIIKALGLREGDFVEIDLKKIN